MKRFDWMYRTLHTPDHSHVTDAQIRNATQILEQVLPLAGQVIELMPPYRSAPSPTLTGYKPR